MFENMVPLSINSALGSFSMMLLGDTKGHINSKLMYVTNGHSGRMASAKVRILPVR